MSHKVVLMHLRKTLNFGRWQPQMPVHQPVYSSFTGVIKASSAWFINAMSGIS